MYHYSGADPIIAVRGCRQTDRQIDRVIFCLHIFTDTRNIHLFQKSFLTYSKSKLRETQKEHHSILMHVIKKYQEINHSKQFCIVT